MSIPASCDIAYLCSVDCSSFSRYSFIGVFMVMHYGTLLITRHWRNAPRITWHWRPPLVKGVVCYLRTLSSVWKCLELSYHLAIEFSLSKAHAPGTVFPYMFAKVHLQKTLKTFIPACICILYLNSCFILSHPCSIFFVRRLKFVYLFYITLSNVTNYSWGSCFLSICFFLLLFGIFCYTFLWNKDSNTK